ncbi:hypothetical protein [Amphritea sp.]|uniref:hypothetical protein n=1 Tax=Amphritea sp. TaxID=1872502 RepID=UPI0025B9AC70|nr:hypothetical protein [Amphritea sp.]
MSSVRLDKFLIKIFAIKDDKKPDCEDHYEHTALQQLPTSSNLILATNYLAACVRK